MGLVFKPKKCRSHSLQRGCPKTQKIYVKDENDKMIEISPLSEKGRKQLGMFITFDNSRSDKLDFIRSKLESKLKNLNECTQIRGEYKLKIFEIYLLASIRYIISIHNLTTSHLSILDTLALKYLKLWIGFPSRRVTNVSITHQHGLNVKLPTTLYLEAHMISFICMNFN